MKLYKSEKWLKYCFHIELILIISFIIAFCITFFLHPENSKLAKVSDKSGLFEKYRIFSSIINLETEQTPDGIDPEKIKNDFVKDFLSLRSIEKTLEEKSYGIIDDFISNFKSDDNYLKSEIERLKLKNIYVKKEYKNYISGYTKGQFGLIYDIYLLKSFRFVNNKIRALNLFKDLFLSNTLEQLKKHLSQSEIKSFLTGIDQEYWNRKLEIVMKAGRYSEFRKIRKYIRNSDLVNYISAEIAYTSKKYAKAKSLLRRINPRKFVTGRAKLLLKMRIRNDDFSDIDKTLNKILPDKSTYNRLLLDIASILRIRGKFKLSTKYFTKYISSIKSSDSKDSESYWRALWAYAWLKVKAKDLPAAVTLFREGINSPILSYRIANLYWSNKLKNSINKKIIDFPFTYYYAKYSHLKKLGKRLDLTNFTKLFNKTGSDRFHSYVLRIKSFLKFGLNDEALKYIEWIKESGLLYTEDLNAIKLIETLIYLRGGDHYYTFTSFVKNFENYQSIILPNFLKEIYLPVRFGNLIQKYSTEFNVNRELVLALINRESMFRHNIISPAKAKGLMQLIDNTAKLTSRQLGIKFRRNNIYIPEINIKLGVAHLKSLLDKYNGKIYLALAAYNAGSHRVKAWLEKFGDNTEEMFIEMIPFSETRNYVKKIIRNYYYYKYYYSPEEWGNIKI